MTHSIKTARARAFHRQNGRCCYCGRPVWLDDPVAFARTHGLTAAQAAEQRATAEHLRARCDGGRGGDNIAAACWLCNRRRHQRREGALSSEDYRQRVATRVQKGRWHSFSLALPSTSHRPER